MTNQYVGGGAGPSRMSLLVAVLLVIALMATLLALLLAMGILQFRPPGGGSVLLSPTPTIGATDAPLESPGTTAEPTAAVPTAAPATAAPSPGGSPQASPGGVHIVQPGETLFDIGLMYGVPMGEIAAANELENPDFLTVGQELIIPIPSSVSPPPGVHVVQSGESVSSIAELYGVSPTDLAEANNIENWDLIYVGQQLVIPGQGAEPSPSPEP